MRSIWLKVMARGNPVTEIAAAAQRLPVGAGARALAAEACRVVGEPPDTALDHLPDLDRLCEAVTAQAGLTASGRARFAAAAIASLVTQLEVRRQLDAVSWIERLALRPVVVTGLLRTGTTLLQLLLAQVPHLWSPQLWQLMRPAATQARERLVAASRQYVQEYYRAAPGFRRMHHLDAELPEECHRLTANTFCHPIYALRYHAPDYAAWLETRSMLPAYQSHRRQLACLVARYRDGLREPSSAAGAPDPARVVLKCPSHLWYLPELAQVYPGATVIRLHRLPEEALPSVCSLTAEVRAARSDAVDLLQIGRYWLERADRVLPQLRPGRAPESLDVVDLRYRDLVADPVGTVADLCQRDGRPLTPPDRGALQAFVNRQRAAGGAPHRYRPKDFGLAVAQLRERYAGYVERFDL